MQQHPPREEDQSWQSPSPSSCCSVSSRRCRVHGDSGRPVLRPAPCTRRRPLATGRSPTTPTDACCLLLHGVVVAVMIVVREIVLIPALYMLLRTLPKTKSDGMVACTSSLAVGCLRDNDDGRSFIIISYRRNGDGEGHPRERKKTPVAFIFSGAPPTGKVSTRTQVTVTRSRRLIANGFSWQAS